MSDEDIKHLTPNQIVAINLRRARDLRRMTQAQAVEQLAKHLGEEWSVAVLSAAERSAHTGRVRQFTADHLFAFSETFDLPVTWFLRLHGGDYVTGPPEAEPVSADRLTLRVEPTRANWPLGTILRTARERKDWSMSQAARAANSSYDHWRAVETGFSIEPDGSYYPYHAHPPTIVKFAEAVRVDIAECLRAVGLDDDVKTDLGDREARRLSMLGALRRSIWNMPFDQVRALATIVGAMVTGRAGAAETYQGKQRLDELRRLISDADRQLQAFYARQSVAPSVDRRDDWVKRSRLVETKEDLYFEARALEEALGIPTDRRISEPSASDYRQKEMSDGTTEDIPGSEGETGR